MITTQKTPSREGIARSCGVTQSSRGTPASQRDQSPAHTSFATRTNETPEKEG